MLQDTAARLVRDAYRSSSAKFSESELGFPPGSRGNWAAGPDRRPFAEEIGGFGGGGVETMLVMTERVSLTQAYCSL